METELQLDHWYMGLPIKVKSTISQWDSKIYEQKLKTYQNPSEEFIKQDKLFLIEMEKYNH